jgi:hypothetical protein
MDPLGSLMVSYKIGNTIILISSRRRMRRRNLKPNFLRIYLKEKSSCVVMFLFYEGKTKDTVNL